MRAIGMGLLCVWCAVAVSGYGVKCHWESVSTPTIEER